MTHLTPAQREDLRQKAQVILDILAGKVRPQTAEQHILIEREYAQAAHPAAILSLLDERDDLTQQLNDQEVEKLELVKEVKTARQLLVNAEFYICTSLALKSEEALDVIALDALIVEFLAKTTPAYGPARTSPSIYPAPAPLTEKGGQGA